MCIVCRNQKVASRAVRPILNSFIVRNFRLAVTIFMAFSFVAFRFFFFVICYFAVQRKYQISGKNSRVSWTEPRQRNVLPTVLNWLAFQVRGGRCVCANRKMCKHDYFDMFCTFYFALNQAAHCTWVEWSCTIYLRQADARWSYVLTLLLFCQRQRNEKCFETAHSTWVWVCIGDGGP